MKKLIIIIVLTLLSASCSQKLQPATPALQSYNYTNQLQIGSQTLMVEVANAPAAQQQGLSDRLSMSANQGMLFEFPSENLPAFWMKQMNFPLDFIWINNNSVVGITNNAAAPAKNASDSELQIYYPPSPVDWVVEVNAGWAEKNNIKAGDSAQLITDNK